VRKMVSQISSWSDATRQEGQRKETKRRVSPVRARKAGVAHGALPDQIMSLYGGHAAAAKRAQSAPRVRSLLLSGGDIRGAEYSEGGSRRGKQQRTTGAHSNVGSEPWNKGPNRNGKLQKHQDDTERNLRRADPKSKRRRAKPMNARDHLARSSFH